MLLKDLSEVLTKHVIEVGKIRSKIRKYIKYLFIYTVFSYIPSNESAIMVAVSEVVVSATVICSEVIGVVVVSGVVVFPEDKKLYKGGAAVKL